MLTKHERTAFDTILRTGKDKARPWRKKDQPWGEAHALTYSRLERLAAKPDDELSVEGIIADMIVRATDPDLIAVLAIELGRAKVGDLL